MGNYTCVVRNVMNNATVYSSPTPVVLRSDGEPTSADTHLALVTVSWPVLPQQ